MLGRQYVAVRGWAWPLDAMDKHHRLLAQQSGWAPPAQRIRELFALAEEWETTHRMTSVRPGVRKQWPGECGREERQHRAEDQEPDCVG